MVEKGVTETIIGLLQQVRDNTQYLKEIREHLVPRVRKSQPRDSTEKPVGLPRLATLWNQWADKSVFAIVRTMPPNTPRHKAALARYREMPKEEYWVGVIRRINKSKFCRGENKGKWRADFTFLVRTETHIKVMEGKFDNPDDGKQKKPKTKIVEKDGQFFEEAIRDGE